MPASLVLLLLGVLILGVMGFVILGLGNGEQTDLIRTETLGARGGFRRTVVAPIDASFVHGRIGGRLQGALVRANVRNVYATEVAMVATILVLTDTLVSSRIVAPFFSLLLGVLTVFALRALLRALEERQRTQFIAQLPELSRILANATGAGLSIVSAIRIAATELPAPAGRELSILDRELAVGTPLDAALERLEARVAGRDLSVLVGTLVISQRSGGSLITALRGLSVTLEDRKETSREVRTLITQASYTGYLVVCFGIGFVLLMNLLTPGVLKTMTSSALGIAAIVSAVLCYGIGLLMIRRMTRVKL